MNELRMVYTELPPSSNKIYFQGTRLTRYAKEYAERFSEWVRKTHLHEIMQLDPTSLYELHLWFYFENVENEAFYKDGPTYIWKEKVNGKLTGRTEERRRSPWAKFDLTNRIKLLEDCVRDAVDIDDSQTFEAHQYKRCDPKNPRVEILLRAIPDPSLIGLKKRE